MKRLALGLLLILATVAGAFAADAATPIPLPRERPAAIRMASLPTESVVAQAKTNPDPFNIQRTDNGPAASAPTNPIVVTAPASNDILGYIWAAIASVFTALFGKLVIKPPALLTGTASSSDSGNVADIVAATLHSAAGGSTGSILKDPNLRANVDAALLKIVQSGLPGQALQAGLSLIPGAGPFVTTLEPLLRNIVTQELQKHAGATPTGTAGATPDPLQPLLDKISAVIDAKLHPAT